MLPDAASHGVDQSNQLLLSTTVNIQTGVVEQDHHTMLQVMLPTFGWKIPSNHRCHLFSLMSKHLYMPKLAHTGLCGP